MDDYLTLIENYRNDQQKDKDEAEPVHGQPEQVQVQNTQNAERNNRDNAAESQAENNGAEEDSTDSTEESEDEQKKKKSKKKSKKNTAKLSKKRAALNLQIDTEELKKFPKPHAATAQQVLDLLTKYDLPKFPPQKNMGHSTVFSNIEEQQMVNYLKEMSTHGFPRTIYQFQSELQYFYQNHCKDKNKKGYVFGMYQFTINIYFLQLIFISNNHHQI